MTQTTLSNGDKLHHPRYGKCEVFDNQSGQFFLKPMTQKGWEAAYQISKYYGLTLGLNDGRCMPLLTLDVLSQCTPIQHPASSIPQHGKSAPYPGKEENLQTATAQLLRMRWPHLLAFHVPNGGKRPLSAVKQRGGGVKMVPIVGKKMKDAGARAGVSDWIILQPIGPYHGLIIELKAKGGSLEDTQTNFLLQAQANGYAIAVVWNLEAFEQVIVDYLAG